MKKPAHAPQQGPADRPLAGVVWRKSSHSLPEGACVEVARSSCGRVLFRDSKVHDGPVMTVSGTTAAVFTSALDRGDL